MTPFPRLAFAPIPLPRPSDSLAAIPTASPISYAETVTYPALAVRDHIVTLNNVMSGCVVDEGNLRSISMAEDDEIVLTYTGTCPKAETPVVTRRE